MSHDPVETDRGNYKCRACGRYATKKDRFSNVECTPIDRTYDV